LITRSCDTISLGLAHGSVELVAVGDVMIASGGELSTSLDARGVGGRAFFDCGASRVVTFDPAAEYVALAHEPIAPLCQVGMRGGNAGRHVDQRRNLLRPARTGEAAKRYSHYAKL